MNIALQVIFLLFFRQVRPINVTNQDDIHIDIFGINAMERVDSVTTVTFVNGYIILIGNIKKNIIVVGTIT